MEKLADISAFEGLPVIQVAVFNGGMLSDISEDLPSYINQSAKDIVSALLFQYRTLDNTDKAALTQLRSDLAKNKRDLQDLFYTLLISAVDLRLWELRDDEAKNNKIMEDMDVF